MAFAIGAAHAHSLNGLFSPGLTPRFDQSASPILDARDNSTTTNNTVNMFIDAQGSDYGYAASVITACVDQTVYALQCTSGPVGVGSQTCGPNGVVSFNPSSSTMNPDSLQNYLDRNTDFGGVGLRFLQRCHNRNRRR